MSVPEGTAPASPRTPAFWAAALAAVPALATIPLLLPWASDVLLWPVLGWLIAVGGGITLLTRFTLADLRARSTGWYAAQDRNLRIVVLAVVAVVLVITVWHAAHAAELIARSDLLSRQEPLR